MSQSQFEQSLFITTPTTILLRSVHASTTLFECDETGGIINARVSQGNSSLFAVADSQIVILRDAARASRKYKLKKADVRRGDRSESTVRPLTSCLGQATSSSVLTRLLHPVLHDDTKPFSPGVLHPERRNVALATAASISTKRDRSIQQRQCTNLGIA